MYFQFGSVRSEQNEVECMGFFCRRNLSPRGDLATETRTLQIVIDQTRTGVQANSARFTQFQNVATVAEVGFLDDNFNRTPIWLSSADTLSGVQILNPPSWTPRSPVEMATHMSIFCGFQAEYRLANADQILDYQESLYFEDEGPKRIVGIETDTGPVEHFTTCLNPRRYLTQQGYIVGRDTYPLANSPMLVDVPMIGRSGGPTSPQKVGTGYIGYRVDWRYVYMVPEQGNWFPRLR